MNKISVVIAFLTATVLLGCQGSKKVKYKYGVTDLKTSPTKNVVLKIHDFKTYGKFIDRLKQINCNDSIPVLAINDAQKNIYPALDKCSSQFIPFCPKAKHFVTFKNGKAYNLTEEINKDSLNTMLINKFAKFNIYETKPYCYLVIIQSLENAKLTGIEQFLNEITTEYNSLDTTIKLFFMFWKKQPIALSTSGNNTKNID